MPEPVTQTEIVNAAAALLGSSERITSMDGAGNLAKHARAIWDMTVRALLTDHPWNFAIERAPMNAGPAPAFGYANSYELPAGCLRLLSWGDGDGRGRVGEVEGGKVLTDAEGPLQARFISDRQISATQQWPAHFTQAVVATLAHRLCEALTGKQGLNDRLADNAQAALRRARRIDGLESQHSKRGGITRRSSWLTGQAINRGEDWTGDMAGWDRIV